MVTSNKDGGGRLRHTQKIHAERRERFIHSKLVDFLELLNNSLVILRLVDELGLVTYYSLMTGDIWLPVTFLGTFSYC
jgi:hypothetical protein